jgi:hypothetical protein
MKLGYALGLGLSLLAWSGESFACPCGVPGLDSALTSRLDSWGVRVAESYRFGSGRFDARGAHRPFEPGEHDERYEVSLLLAHRPLSSLELSARVNYLRDSMQAGGMTSSLAGMGDVIGRARLEVVEESPLHADHLPMPEVALTGALRAPTGHASESMVLGLGAWEAAAGVALERSVSPKVRLGLAAEAGLRSSDSSLGVSRRLGPRLSGQLSAWYWPLPQVALSANSGLEWEGDTELAGARRAGTGSRQWLVGAGAVYRPAGSRLIPGLSARYTVPLPDVTVSALAATSLELSLAYTR